MNTFAILRPRTPTTGIPEDVVAALKRGDYVPAGTITCTDGAIPAWRSEATRGNLYASFDTGEIYGCTSQAMCSIGHVFTALDYRSLIALKDVDGGDIAIAVGEPERLSGVLLEALGKAYDPESLRGTVEMRMSETAAIRLILIGLGEAHRAPEGLDALWTNLTAGSVMRTVTHDPG